MAQANNERTPEKIEADRLRMEKVRAARQNKKPKSDDVVIQNNVPIPESNPPITEAPTVTIAQQELEDLKRQVSELQNLPWQILGQFAPKQDVAINAGGQLTGTVEKYPLLSELYPDPRERLADEEKLQRFAFKINYELNYEVGESRYETIDHVRMVEPKFTIELIRKVLDPTSGEDTGGRYVLAVGIFHEDPETAVIIARQLGMDIDSSNEQAFLNEMRYLRMRDWLISRFYPPKIEDKQQRKDMVIDGRLVQYFEVNSQKGGVKSDNWNNVSDHKL